MSVDSIESSIQSTATEQYRIRAKRQEQTTQQIQEIQRSEQVQQEQRVQAQRAEEVDVYDKANPVGTQAEGVYSVSHDESGNLKVNYTQPASKSDSEEEALSSAPKAEASKPAGGTGGASSVSSTSSDDDDELEELKKQRDAIRQQLNREANEDVKAQLRTQLQSIEMQIALKSTGVEA